MKKTLVFLAVTLAFFAAYQIVAPLVSGRLPLSGVAEAGPGAMSEPGI